MTDDKALQAAREEVYRWQTNPKADWFTAKLLSLMAKADALNSIKLGVVYPYEQQAYLEWLNSPSSDECFKNWGLK